jgi:RNA polymerase sigma-70 factor (ECF subfamily)
MMAGKVMERTRFREMNNVHENSLVEAASREPQAFVELYTSYVGRVYRYVHARVANQRDAEDLTSQVFLDALKSLPSYRSRAPFAAWLFSIARQRVADYYRHGKQATHANIDDIPLSSGENVLQHVIHEENLDALAEVVTRLDEQEQELLRLRFAAEMTFVEIAALLGCKEDAVKKRFYRLLARLQNQLEE